MCSDANPVHFAQHGVQRKRALSAVPRENPGGCPWFIMRWAIVKSYPSKRAANYWFGSGFNEVFCATIDIGVQVFLPSLMASQRFHRAEARRRIVRSKLYRTRAMQGVLMTL